MSGDVERLLEAAFKVSLSDVAPPQRLAHVLLKQSPVVLQHLRRLLVERVLRVWLLHHNTTPWRRKARDRRDRWTGD